MRGGINAAYIDAEYRRREIYENKKRKKCAMKYCEDCNYRKICEDNEESLKESDGVEIL